MYFLKFISVFILIILLLITRVAFSEYQIKEAVVPSFLNYTFVNLTDDIFPSDITIDLLVSRFSGNLLYSIDNGNNQLIISLSDVHPPTLDIEFNTQHFYVSLSKLCARENPKYNRLRLRIQIREIIYLQCNDETMDIHKYDKVKKLNRDYPIPKFEKSDKRQAFLWLVNTPHMDDIYPNNAQLSGCIFEVTYNKQPLTMGKYGTGDKCPITCTNNVCNNGQCQETHNKVPVCNCTDSFMNGDYCNDPLNTRSFLMAKGNGRNNRKKKLSNSKTQLQFKAIKLVFQRASEQLFDLNNTHTTLQLRTNNNNLVFTLISNVNPDMRMDVTLSRHYDRSKKFIVILEFKEEGFDITYRAENSSWTFLKIPHFLDLSRLIFHYLSLKVNDTEDGIIALSYKNDFKEMRWIQLAAENNELIFNVTTKNGQGKSTARSTNPQTHSISTGIRGIRIKGIENAEAVVSRKGSMLKEIYMLRSDVRIVLGTLWLFLILVILYLCIKYIFKHRSIRRFFHMKSSISLNDELMELSKKLRGLLDQKDSTSIQREISSDSEKLLK